MGFGLPEVAAAAQAEAADAPGQGAFDPGATCILPLPYFAALLPTAGLQSHIDRLLQDRQSPRVRPATWLGGGAQGAVGAGATAPLGKANTDDGGTPFIPILFPALADLAGGTSGCVLRPEDGKGPEVGACPACACRLLSGRAGPSRSRA